ncbi:zinc finger CCCH-type with G patch domain-containing [Brachionus plicatilis]|uniref:Zinc finger CCCH-type with G patch domain-containing protein n=1 Tax=Brachionus plicatilis TaxID=10195 RepID=A0A3M7T076_BRAPC|nr:zinc finger CCCH-type with G patch domain-containing [Brachionus plicatilis]
MEGEDSGRRKGTKCRVNFDCKNTNLKLHNAIILGTDSESDQTIRVLFCNPTQTNMKTCEHFMNNECTFDSACKYSHGFKVQQDHLHSYLEPCYDHLKSGILCLAKWDNLWHLAEVQSFDEQFIYVQFKRFNRQMGLEWEDVLVLDLPENDQDFESTSELSDLEVEESEAERPSYNGAMASWEKHTRGIGSKLMLKMGYELGKGLGREGEGRVEPVEVTVLPGGVSLDKAFEIKRKKKIKRQKKEKKVKNCQPEPDLNVFEFINSKLISENEQTQAQSSKKDISKANNKGLNIKMLDTHNKIKDEEKYNAKLKQSLARNRNADKKTLDCIKQKIAQSDRALDELKKSESHILNEKISRKRKSDLF